MKNRGNERGHKSIGFENSNNDNQFTSADTQWANIKVWVDANPNGSTFTASGTGTLTTTEGNIKSYTAGNAGEKVDVAQKGVNNAQGGSGNDILIGDANANWLDVNNEKWSMSA